MDDKDPAAEKTDGGKSAEYEAFLDRLLREYEDFGRGHGGPRSGPADPAGPEGDGEPKDASGGGDGPAGPGESGGGAELTQGEIMTALVRLSRRLDALERRSEPLPVPDAPDDPGGLRSELLDLKLKRLRTVSVLSGLAVGAGAGIAGAPAFRWLAKIVAALYVYAARALSFTPLGLGTALAGAAAGAALIVLGVRCRGKIAFWLKDLSESEEDGG